MTDESRSIEDHPVVSRQKWDSARKELLAREKEFTRLRDEVSRQRRELPWVKLDKPYRFEGPGGVETLVDLFAGRSQLIVYHFMFMPEWTEGCPHCSFWADSFNGIGVHLNHRDTTFVAVSRASTAKIEAFRKRMGWTFKWVSSGDTDFNYDFAVSFRPEDVRKGTASYNYAKIEPEPESGRVASGLEQVSQPGDREGTSVFYRNREGAVFHTYSAYARGIDLVNTAYNYLDLTPKGRDEDNLPWVQAWVRHHDRYED
jgi:predicted dithiol-disulfide oxidoreductase (DUF899 family)